MTLWRILLFLILSAEWSTDKQSNWERNQVAAALNVSDFPSVFVFHNRINKICISYLHKSKNTQTKWEVLP